MNNNQTQFLLYSSSSSSSSVATDGVNSSGLATSTVITPEGTQTTSYILSSDLGAIRSQASANALSNGGTVTANVQPINPESVSRISIAMNSADHVFAIFPLLVDPVDPLTVSSNSSETSFRPVPLVDYVLGTATNDQLVGQINRDVLVGYAGADLFVLSATGSNTVTQADVIADFSFTEGDRIGLPTGITFRDLVLQPIDLDLNGSLESTIIGLRTTENILAIAPNTVDSLGVSLFSQEQFLTMSTF